MMLRTKTHACIQRSSCVWADGSFSVFCFYNFIFINETELWSIMLLSFKPESITFLFSLTQTHTHTHFNLLLWFPVIKSHVKYRTSEVLINPGHYACVYANTLTHLPKHYTLTPHCAYCNSTLHAPLQLVMCHTFPS